MNKFLKVIVALLTIFVSNNLLAQGTTCAGAPVITVNGACVTSFTINDATATAPAPSCGVTAQEGWYQFTIGATSNISIVGVNSNRNLVIQLISGACPGGLVEAYCENSVGAGGGTETLLAPGLAAGIYFVKIVNIGGGGSMSMTSLCITTYTSGVANDDPCTATAVAVGASCSYTTYTNAAATATAGAPAPGCASYAGGDVWFTAVVPASGHLTFDSNIGVITDGGMAVYSGTCGSLSLLSCDDDASSNGLMPYLDITGLTVGSTVWIRFWEFGGDNNGTFNLCVYDGGATAGPSNDNPCTATPLTVNSTCVYTASTNSGATASSGVPAPGCASYVGGDVWFTVTVPASGQLIFDSNTGVITDGGMAIYSGTCASLTLLACDDDASTNGLMPMISLTGLTPGTTLYVRFWEYSNDNQGSFSICVHDPCSSGCSGTPTAGTTSASPASTSCASLATTLTLTGSSTGCGISYQWQSSPDNIVWTNIAGATALTYAASVGVNTYFRCIVTCSYSGLTATSTTTLVTFSGVLPANDLPCSALSLSLGISTTGNNSCATNTSEGSAPVCWVNGGAAQVNTVWYTFVAPASGQVSIRTGLGTLTNTQIAAYSGACGSLTMIASACNNDITLCTETQSWSELVLTGLTPGTTYYVAVDGYQALQGDFSIIAIDGTSVWPVIFGQDCSAPMPVCSQISSIGNPGFIGSGNYCDYPGSTGCPAGSCIFVGERNSVWYNFSTSAAGTIMFTLTPNTPVDYDWALYDVTGNAAACSQIAAGTLLPVRCSYSGLTTATGMGAPGTETCDGTLGTLDAWASTMAVPSGGQYILFVSNFSTSTFVGYTLDWGTSPINYSAASTLTWTGATSTNWNLSQNWGGCGVPDCTKDVVIFSGPTNQPNILTGTTMSCRSITIQASASLTLSGTGQLNVCGDFTNNGSLITSNTSTVNFVGTALQTISGSVSGTNAFGNLTVTKATGSVITNQATDMKGNLTTATATSILNLNAQYIKVAGNFVNNAGATTMTGVAGSTIEFNGTAAQTYTQGSSTLDLDQVLMNHSSTGLTLLSDMNLLATTGTLTLTAGKIITGALQVYAKRSNIAAVTVGNATSYVEGFLRRAVSGTGAFEFPVGTSVKGYQRATVDFTTATTLINNLRANFNNWAVVPGPLGTTDCTVPYNLPFLDNGYWTINAFNGAGTQITGDGVYTSTLWPSVGSYTNAASAVEWTVAKDPTNTLAWSIVGTCNLASTVNQVIRNAMSGFSGFSVEQSTTTLPVELISFTGEKANKNHFLKWNTASEINNQWFVLEQSGNGFDFIEIYRTPGQVNSNSSIAYDFLFRYPDPGLNYYRLRQINTDGTSAYSDIVILDNTSDLITLNNLYPNPTNGDIQFDLTSGESESFSIEIYDIAGKIVMQKKHIQDEGKRTVSLPTSELARGVYTLKVLGNTSNFKSINRIVRN